MKSPAPQPLDRNGALVTVGHRVRIIGLSGDWVDTVPVDEQADVRSMIGQVFVVEEIDEWGQPWVEKVWRDEADGSYHTHSIALEPQDMEVVADDPPAGSRAPR